MSSNIEHELSDLPSNFITQFFRGVSYPLKALSFISKHNLWGSCVWPIVINVILFVTLIVLSVLYADDLRNLIWDKPTGEGFVHGLLLGLWHTLHVLLMLILFLVDVILFAVLGTVIAGPFLDILSEKTEKIIGSYPAEPSGLRAFMHSIVYSIFDVFLILAFYVAMLIPLLLLNVIPLVGSLLYLVASTAFAWLLLTLDFVSLPLNRRMTAFSNKWKTVWHNKWVSLGFGCAIFFILFIPVLNMILIPLAAVGGTLYYGELKKANRLFVSATKVGE